MKIRIREGQRLNADYQWEASQSIDIEHGRIVGFDLADTGCDQLIDASGCLILPGLIDLNVALREPGYTSKGTIASETRAAAAGGVSTLCCSPQTLPVNDSRAVTKLIYELAHTANYCEVLPLGALTKDLQGEHLSEYAALKSANCVALSNAYYPFKSLAIAKRCFDYAKTHGMSVFVNPIESSLHKGVMHEGHISTTIGLQGISPLAETIAVSQLLQLAAASGVHLHLSQLSVANSVEQVAQAKASGIQVSADVALQNLLFTDERVEAFNSVFHCLPPFRSEEDRQALIAGVLNGVIDAVTSAHQPHEAAAKLMPFAETEPGMSTIEFILPMGQLLESAGLLTIAQLVKSMTKGASEVLHRSPPALAIGQEASLVVYDPAKSHVVSEQSIVSSGKNTPFIGQTIKGRVKATLFKGREVYSINDQ